jgi:hypothetical protein
MNLKEFLTPTIVEIMEGLQEAQEQVGGKGMVNPPSVQSSKGRSLVLREGDESSRFDGRHVHMVEFDVAVTAASGAESKAGAGLLVAAIGLGVQAQKSQENTAISRIRFEVPVAYPAWRPEKPDLR